MNWVNYSVCYSIAEGIRNDLSLNGVFWPMELNFISCNFFHLLLFEKHGMFAILLYPSVGLVIACITLKVSSNHGDTIP